MRSPCIFAGCSGKRDRSSGYCQGHHYQLEKFGFVKDIAPRGEADTGWFVNRDGYVIRDRRPKGVRTREYQHRVVMEDYLGRSLASDEYVHHVNGDRSDNSLANLELWSTMQPSGQRAVDKLEWARQIIALYEPQEALLRGESPVQDDGLPGD